MFDVDFCGTNEELIVNLEEAYPGVMGIVQGVYDTIPHYTKREIRLLEGALLYILATQYNHPDAHIFEIGTCWGWSAAVMSTAAPLAQIVTCTPNHNHAKIATYNLAKAGYSNIEVVDAQSQTLLADYKGPLLDMVFVDGDHKRVEEDLPWYNWLKVDGLIFHHDYSHPDAPVRPCRWVWKALNHFCAEIHPPDVLLMNDEQEGMMGHYRREGEMWG